MRNECFANTFEASFIMAAEDEEPFCIVWMST
jgi:hypothetical protein